MDALFLSHLLRQATRLLSCFVAFYSFFSDSGPPAGGIALDRHRQPPRQSVHFATGTAGGGVHYVREVRELPKDGATGRPEVHHHPA